MADRLPMETATLSVDAISKKIGKHPILSDVSFQIAGGGVHALVGLNGAGKTTLLRILTGLWSPSTGQVFVKGMLDPRRNRGARAHMGSLVESPSLFPELTPKEHLVAYGRFHGPHPLDHADRALKEVGLYQQADKKVRHLSLGMKQRLGIALALIGDPQLVILDEPTNGLDPAGMVEMRRLIRQRASENGTAFLISSHQLSELEEISDRILLLHMGQLHLDRPMAEFKLGLVKRFVIRATPTDRVRAFLENRYGASRVAVSKDGSHITEPEVDDSASCIAEMVRADLALHSYAPERLTLEQLFLRVVGTPE
jgi:ABC-2 type transport system ATP-binding protein